jgi:hypothetical protein
LPDEFCQDAIRKKFYIIFLALTIKTNKFLTATSKQTLDDILAYRDSFFKKGVSTFIKVSIFAFG